MAVPLPASARDAVVEVAERVRASVDGVRARWVRFDGLHLTLQFLGPTPASAVASLGDAVAEIAARGRRFEIRLGGAGAFPSADRPRALWVGIVAGREGLAALAQSVAEDPRVMPWLPAPHGDAATSGRRYAPHLTIARTDGVPGASRLARALEVEAADLDVAFEADRVVLFRSVLGRGPARYETVTEARLGG